MGQVWVANEELRTIRDAMRELNRLVEALDRGEREKFVLTHRNQMRAVLLPLERYGEMERRLAQVPAGTGAGGELRATLSPPGQLASPHPWEGTAA